MKCPKCNQRQVRVGAKPRRYECRNPKCKKVAPKLNSDKLFPSLAGKAKKK